MLKKAFTVKLNPNTASDQDSEVVQWFSRMDRESIHASIEYTEGGKRKVNVVGLISEPISSSEDDATLITQIVFERYKMKDSGDGAFWSMSPVETFDDFKTHFVVEEVKQLAQSQTAYCQDSESLQTDD